MDNSPVNLLFGQPHYLGKDRDRQDYIPSRDYQTDSQLSNSPDPSRQRLDQNKTPEDSSRAYSSQRNSDDSNRLAGYHSPDNDSAGSRSPENLSSSTTSYTTTTNNNNNNNTAKFNNHLNEMLDHKLQLSFLGPPLAALHSMTEMKGQSSPNAPQGTQVASNPHGIDTILSRPPPVTSAGLNALASGKISSNFRLTILLLARIFDRIDQLLKFSKKCSF